ncbi:MAG: hypothetical protein K1X70_09600 [Leptospirales bacterium]|nr:hypothetical protein [Leptospirales bacterium]
MEDKIIVTNRKALVDKYGVVGLNKIDAAISELIRADKNRGVKSRIIFLDDAAMMRKIGSKAVTTPTTPRDAKVAIDRVFKSFQPDYLMILGATDVIPHQDLVNPAFKAGDDDDPAALGDLPYACDSAYSKDTAQFIGPTRVVARLPDLTGAKEPSHLLRLLATAAEWKNRPAKSYADYFGLSAQVWSGSTRLSLQNVFGNSAEMKLSPPSGPWHKKQSLGALAHFINCHGGPAAPEFYGQDAHKYSTALTTGTISRNISKGTVAAIECCYGCELYDSVTLGLPIPICQSYLRQGAYGYFGSTTIAYGPSDENGAADLICQFFLLSLLQGASIGRAALEARHKFVEQTGQMDAIDLKTLAQFCLYGDPSIVPVAPRSRSIPPKGTTAEALNRFSRSERRAKLRATGEFLKKTKPTASKRESAGKISKASRSALSTIARKAGLRPALKFTAFKVKGVGLRRKGIAGKAMAVPSRYYVAVGADKKLHTKGGHKIAVVAKEQAGRIVGYRIYHAR